jgi:methylmalonyl-CoA/ethylmalonyl-CoA epimerase
MDVTFDPTRIFHWGYVVPNMDRAMASWQKGGARVIVPPAIDPIQNVSCALLVYKGSAPIELVAPLPEGPNPVEGRLKKGGGLDHVCFFTDDLEADLETLRQEGGLTVVEPCYGAVFDRRLAFVVTRMGLTVELMTRKAVGRSATDPLADFMRAD